MSQVLQDLATVVTHLPAPLAQQVLDFALFLKQRHALQTGEVDYSDGWTREDELDAARAAAMAYDAANPDDEGYDDVPTR